VRRRNVIAGASALAAWPLVAAAQQQRVRRVGVLMGLPADTQGEGAALEQGLNELGWTAGRNLELVWNWSGADPERIQSAARQLIRQQCEVIVARGTPVVEALVKETQTIPIVFAVVVDPVGSGFVESFARPGRNVTGFQNYEFSMVGRWVQTLQEMAPELKRIAYIYNPATAPPGFLRALEGIAPSITAQLIPSPVRNATEIDSSLSELSQQPHSGVMNIPDIWLTANRKQIIAAAAKYRLPAIYTLRVYSTDDGLMSYGPVTADLFHRAASYVDRILKGEKPADLPVQAPIKYELVINLKTAKTIGISVPPTILARADEVIE